MKASLGIALLAKNSSRTLGACLDSIVPYAEQVVVCVDSLSTDDTADIARAHGAEVYPIEVSGWHECPQHGRVLAQDFARARDESFTHLRADLDWWMWIDSDDVLEHGEKLVEYLGAVPAEVEGIWLPYNYSRAGKDGPSTTLFDRERIVRPRLDWVWHHRVHEVLQPRSQPIESVKWTRTEEVTVIHQHVGHDTGGSARRNILLLEIELEQDPNSQWALFYMGNQWFALDEWGRAASYYEMACENDNRYQLFQTLIYLSMAYERLGNLELSRQAAWRAADVVPFHPEPYYRLAACYMLAGEVQYAEFWTHFGDTLPDPPGFVFKNPLDRPYNARLCLAQAYGNAGMVSRALREFEAADKAANNPVVKEAVSRYREMEADGIKAESLATVLRELPEDRRLDVWHALKPDEGMRRFGRVRDLVMPAIVKGRASTQPRIVFWCGRSLEPWAPPSIDGTGIGGSETAVIQIAKRFAADGWRVDVYNEPDRYEGEYEGVGYWSISRLAAESAVDVFVSWRNPAAYDAPISRRLSLLWCHDLHSGPGREGELAKWDRVLGVSQWHADYLAQVYGLTNTDYVPNGIDPGRFATDVRKVPFRCVYASSPDRGLERVLEMWPFVLQMEPGAELHVGYGWDTIDQAIQHGAGDLIPVKARIQKALERTERVVWRGRLPQDELAKLYQESYFWLYPTSFLEVSCISAMEAMAGGCVPITSDTGALRGTIGNAGVFITGNTYTTAWREFYTLVVRGMLGDVGQRKRLARLGRERAAGLTWDASYEKWKRIVGEGNGEKKEARMLVEAGI